MHYSKDMDKKTIIEILSAQSKAPDPELLSLADTIRKEHYGDKVFLRGLIEFTNYCKNGCFYCGLQNTNKDIKRYRLNKEEILNCCKTGYALGFRTFVMQGGEDPYFDDEMFCGIIREIRKTYPDCAITLSFGEKSYDTYKKYYEAGANRYLLRHETINNAHYSKLHPSYMTIETRVKCLENLKEIGFQTGAGIMVGSPYQTIENIAEDLIFLRDFKPHMIGIGPFMPQNQTLFKDFPAGELNQTVTVLALARILLPKVLLPATTALASVSEKGRELGLKSGCNVVMPNLSPSENRKNYALYDNKASLGKESAEGLKLLCETIKNAGYTPDFSRGDHVAIDNQ